MDDESREIIQPFLTLNPGYSGVFPTINIHGPRRSATLTTQGGTLSVSLDVQSPSFQFASWGGIQFNLYNTFYKTDAQVIEPQLIEPPYDWFGIPAANEEEDGDDNESSKESSGSRSGSRSTQGYYRSVKNVGTSMEVYHSLFIPSLYLGRAGLRFGMGVGLGTVGMNGLVDFSDAYGRTATLRAVYEPKDRLPEISRWYFLSGMLQLNDDPVIQYLATDIENGDSLETLGWYLITSDRVRLHHVELPFAELMVSTNLFSGGRERKLNTVELYALLSMQRSVVDFRNQATGAYMIFLEIPHLIPGTKLRLDMGGPVFERRGFRYEFQTYRITVYHPIDFGRLVAAE